MADETKAPEVIKGLSNAHDSASQAVISGLITVCVTFIALALIIASIFNPAILPVAIPVIAMIVGGLINALQAPSGVGSVIASAAKALLGKTPV